ncbi:GntR family transcriptional regulator [Pseudonocardia kujensis]|uniref:GntR family transcriptional regulator n=1 Tax=Pseudonocardia kujensis TaxID=1128675 RepID=UPI001E5E5F76|nr:GntR family transcriptional regulator [Pseudonocardia kujensis]MCE0762055.1 GntR family transcriptional regulator [Pseudonocardia kujensis]
MAIPDESRRRLIALRRRRAQSLTRRARETAVRRVADLVRAALLTGDGGRLPSEDDLQRHFEVSRNVVRDALDSLRGEGLIRRSPGTGTFVVGERFDHRVDRLGGFHPQGAQVQTRREVLEARSMTAPPIVRERLGLPGGSGCVMVEHVTVVNDEPTGFWTSYLPPDLDAVPGHIDTCGSLHQAVVAVAGCEVGEIRTALAAALAGPSVALSLAITEGDPVIRQEQVTVLADGRTCEFAIGWTRADRMIMQTVRRPGAAVPTVPPAVARLPY